jgi:hypothetical protein
MPFIQDGRWKTADGLLALGAQLTTDPYTAQRYDETHYRTRYLCTTRSLNVVAILEDRESSELGLEIWPISGLINHLRENR